MTTKHKVLYVPLDDRPCNYQYPLLLAGITDDVELLAPPFSLMGRLKRAADTDAIWDWLFEQAADAEYAVLSVDTLVYGNIIHSRIHQRTMAQIDGYLENFRRLKKRFPRLSIHAFNLVARVAGYDGSFEDPDYWADYGRRIWRYGWLTDRISRGAADEKEAAELAEITAAIPADILADFLSRREKDAYVNARSVELVKEGVFDRLVVPKDDTAEYGYAAIDQKKLSKKIFDERVMDRVMVYPGADEVGSVLFARVFCLIKGYRPRIYVRFSSTLGPTVIPRYEDRPLAESIKAQITSLGVILTGSAAESDFLFAVHSPGRFQIECGEQEKRDLSFVTHTNLHEFFAYMRDYAETRRRPVALSDVAYCNGADIAMMRHAQQAGILELIAAYGGWNTAENTNGMCLAHACIHSYYAARGFAGEGERRSREFCARKVFEDYLFQATIITEGCAEIEKRYPGHSPYYCADIEDEVAAFTGGRLREKIEAEFNGRFQGRTVTIGDFTLPWDRVHELGFTLTLA